MLNAQLKKRLLIMPIIKFFAKLTENIAGYLLYREKDFLNAK